MRARAGCTGTCSWKAVALRTWALPQPPAVGSEMRPPLLADHRPAYLDYEGPVSGGRGTVACWDRGNYTLVAESEGELAVVLMGSQFCGRVELRREPGDSASWRVSINSSSPLPPGEGR